METELTFGNSRVFLEAGVWWQTSIFFSLLNQERFRHFSAVLSADSTNISCYEIRHSPGNKRHIPATSMILRIEISLIHLRKLSSRDQSSTVANDNFSRPTCSHRLFTILTGSHGSVFEWNAELPHRLTGFKRISQSLSRPVEPVSCKEAVSNHFRQRGNSKGDVNSEDRTSRSLASHIELLFGGFCRRGLLLNGEFRVQRSCIFSVRSLGLVSVGPPVAKGLICIQNITNNSYLH